MSSPAMLVGSVLTSLTANRWWQAFFGIVASYAVARIFFLKSVDSYDSTMSFELNSAFGTIAVGLILVAFISGIRLAFLKTQHPT